MSSAADEDVLRSAAYAAGQALSTAAPASASVDLPTAMRTSDAGDRLASDAGDLVGDVCEGVPER